MKLAVELLLSVVSVTIGQTSAPSVEDIFEPEQQAYDTQQDDNDAAQLFKEAIALQQAGHYDEAIAAYRKFLQGNPDAAPVRSNLGACLAQEARYAEAVTEYSQALKDDPDNIGIRLNLGLAMYKSGDVAKAIQEFEVVYAALPESDPDHHRVLLLLAECHLRQGEFDRVVALLQPIEDAGADDGNVDYMLGTALLRQGDTDRGALLIDKLLKKGDSAGAHMLMAYTQWKARDMQKALVEVNQAIALDPKLPEAHSLRGRLAFLESDLKGAEESFQTALKLDPNDFGALLWLGTVLREEGRLQESESALTHALQLRPDDVRARFQYAHLVSNEGDDERAAQLLESLIADHPDFIEAHSSLATIYFRLGRRDDGRREKKIFEKLHTESRESDESRGKIFTP
jgi:tetratricopeptide (TPR) repeat protein